MPVIARFVSVLALILCFHTGHAMDLPDPVVPVRVEDRTAQELLSLPSEIWAHVFACLHSGGMSQEELVVQLYKLREVCTSWHAILTDDFIANLIDLQIKAENYQELEVEAYLAQAVKDEDAAKIIMVCKLYPKVSRTKAVRHVFCKELLEKNVSMKYLKLLIDLGMNPNVEFDGERPLFLYILHAWRHTWLGGHDKAYETCLDLLIDTYIDTQDDCFLFWAAGQGCIPALYALLQKPLPPDIDLSELIGFLCLNVCKHENKHEHLMNVMHTLLQRGAQVPKGHRILAEPVNRGILPWILLLLQHDATLENPSWLCESVLSNYYQWHDQDEAKRLVPEIITLALEKGDRYCLFANCNVLTVLLCKNKGTYLFTGDYFYPCIKRVIETCLSSSLTADTCIDVLRAHISDPKILEIILQLTYPLHILAAMNEVTSLQKLVTAGVPDINIFDEAGRSALWYAVKYHAREAVNCLIEAGADVRTMKKTDFKYLSHDGQLECIHDLCNAVWSLPKLSLNACIVHVHKIYASCASQHVKKELYGCLITNLMKNTKRPGLLEAFYTKYPELLNERDQHGNTILHHAAIHLKSPVVQYLVEQPFCDVNMYDADGKTALEIISLKLRSRNPDNLTDLEIKAEEISNLLLLHGAILRSASRLQKGAGPAPELRFTLDPIPVQRIQARSQPVMTHRVAQPVPAPAEFQHNHAALRSKFKYAAGLAGIVAAGYAAYRYWESHNAQTDEDADTRDL